MVGAKAGVVPTKLVSCEQRREPESTELFSNAFFQFEQLLHRRHSLCEHRLSLLTDVA